MPAEGSSRPTPWLDFIRSGWRKFAPPAALSGAPSRLLDRAFKPWALVPRYTDDPSPARFDRLVTKTTKLVWIETPTNPLLQLLDIAAVATLAHRAGALLAVDNTF